MLFDSQALAILLSEEFRELVEQNIERDHNAIALDKKLPHSALVATQVKYLQRAKRKLPSYYEARCIIPMRAYEQCSSEATAALKGSGEVGNKLNDSLLELTCGLGVDALFLSRSFARVVTLERDEALAAIACENFKRLKINNIEVVNSSAEEFLEQTSDSFDVIYVDPDRRSISGDRVVRLEECSPNIIELKELIMSRSRRLIVKLSPLFDVDEALRIFAPAIVEVVSAAGECKELIVTTLGVQGGDESALSAADKATIDNVIKVTAVGIGSAEVCLSELDNTPSLQQFDTERYTHLITPDVALQKSRTACHFMRGRADIWSNNSYAFARMETDAAQQQTEEGIIGRIEQIERIEEYNPKRLKKELKELKIKGLEILKRDFPYSAVAIAKQLNVRQGGEKRVAFTTIQNRLYTIFLR